MKILIAVINNRKELSLQFYKSLFGLYNFTRDAGHDMSAAFFDYGDIARTRNNTAQEAVKNGFDYIYFLDVDEVYPYDSIVKLLAHEKEVISGFYVARTPPHAPVHYKKVLLGDLLRSEDNLLKPNTGIQEQEAGGFGGILIKREIFEKISHPWFQYMWDEKNNGWIGEDIYFFKKLSGIGVKAYVDTNLHYGHIFTGVVYPDQKIQVIG